MPARPQGSSEGRARVMGCTQAPSLSLSPAPLGCRGGGSLPPTPPPRPARRVPPDPPHGNARFPTPQPPGASPSRESQIPSGTAAAGTKPTKGVLAGRLPPPSPSPPQSHRPPSQRRGAVVSAQAGGAEDPPTIPLERWFCRRSLLTLENNQPTAPSRTGLCEVQERHGKIIPPRIQS